MPKRKPPGGCLLRKSRLRKKRHDRLFGPSPIYAAMLEDFRKLLIRDICESSGIPEEIIRGSFPSYSYAAISDALLWGR